MTIRRLPLLLTILLLEVFQGASALWFGIFGSEAPPEPRPEVPTAPSTQAPSAKPVPAPTYLRAPTPAPTVSVPLPGPKPPSPTTSPTTPAPTINDDYFTIIVLSDVENKWRGHSIDRSRYVVQYVKSVKDLNLYFDDEYSDYPIDPKLIINTGDISHYWACHNPNYLSLLGVCREPDDEFLDIWQQIYDSGIPMISAYGNHDWKPRNGTGNYYRTGGATPSQPRDEETDNINRWSSEFVHKSYERAAVMGELQFEEIPPTGAIGQSMYRSTFRGLQLASFNSAYNWQSYDDSGIFSADDQFQRLADTLNRSQPTLFFSHFPISATRLDGQTPNRNETIALIQEFPGSSHHFAGHYHAYNVQEYPGFNDYIVPYPHAWGNREPGFLAVLVSPQGGVLQVKPMEIPGLDDGAPCVPVNLLTVGNYINIQRRPAQTLHQRLDQIFGFDGLENGCDRCKAGRQFFSSVELGWVCGEEPNEDHTVDWDHGEDQEVLDSLDQAELFGEI